MANSPEHSAHVVDVATAPNEQEADVIVAALEEEGIKSSLSGAGANVFRLDLPGDVQILVAQEDEARAREIIREGEDDVEEVDWSQVDVGEPEDE